MISPLVAKNHVSRLPAPILDFRCYFLSNSCSSVYSRPATNLWKSSLSSRSRRCCSTGWSISSHAATSFQSSSTSRSAGRIKTLMSHSFGKSWLHLWWQIVLTNSSWYSSLFCLAWVNIRFSRAGERPGPEGNSASKGGLEKVAIRE